MRSLRVVRQMMLPEVGILGQKKIEAAVVRVSGEPFSKNLCERYLRAAGVQRVLRGDEPSTETAVESGRDESALLALIETLSHPVARAGAKGAYDALACLRKILETDRRSAE